MASEKGRVDQAAVEAGSRPVQAAGTSPAGPAVETASPVSHPTDRRDPEALRREIEQTRAEMDSTLDELSDRISPRHLLDELFEFWHGGDSTRGARRGFRETGIRLAESVRDHPVPAALIGAGLAWLLFEDRSPRARRRVERFAEEDEGLTSLAKRSRSHSAGAGRRTVVHWLDEAPLAAGAAALAAGLAAGLLLPETTTAEAERSEEY